MNDSAKIHWMMNDVFFCHQYVCNYWFICKISKLKM